MSSRKTEPSQATLRQLWPDDRSLPAWTYHDADFFEAEKEAVFQPSWQIVCHLSDVPQPGDFHTFDFLNESLVIVRGEDARVRAFHNVCRHRGSRLLDKVKGRCNGRIACPYHRWSYAYDGRLIGVPHLKTFRNFDMGQHGLVPVEHEVFMGFVFARLAPGLPSVREMFAPCLAELADYRLEELVPQGRVTLRPRHANWKNVADNYSDGQHISVAHPGLARLFGRNYGLEARHWVDKMWGELSEEPSSAWSERLYQALLPPVESLPPVRRRLWAYYKLWPNIAFDIYPDQVDFMQFLPVSPTRTLIREIAYVHPDKRREMRAARYLNWRINRQVNSEDTALIERVQAGMASSSFKSGPLGENEVCLRSFAQRMRSLIPECRRDDPPPAGWRTRKSLSR
jgi:carnitine monooxygenase subunit